MENSWDRLKFPNRFARSAVGERPSFTWLRESSPRQETWEAEVVFDEEGRMFLTRGWKEFALAYDLQRGSLPQFRHRGGNPTILVKIFDGMMCRRHYHPVVDEDGRLLRR